MYYVTTVSTSIPAYVICSLVIIMRETLTHTAIGPLNHVKTFQIVLKNSQLTENSNQTVGTLLY